MATLLLTQNVKTSPEWKHLSEMSHTEVVNETDELQRIINQMSQLDQAIAI